ncbi:cytochrome c [Belnapia sp. T6]|uniref:Cytochrome c n=2 Tax=Belnapia mucosa TaxID=2804532 RepID=A0ABS1V184_9PROT|nr:cytochrome c [Belnapia mucosa]
MRALLLLALLLAAPRAMADSADITKILRGRYLATVGDCIACHTGPNGQYAGGRGIETPFGLINAPNLTPDSDTGIGQWSEADFARAMHEGVRPNGDRLYPAFPYPWYTKVTREDTDAIFAFLRTLPAVRNTVDRDTLPFPFSVRTVMRGWNLLFFSPGYYEPRADRSAEWNRGAYLVEGLGHCSACHTARNALGGDSSAAWQGGPLQGWFAPNLTNDARQGVGNWSVEDIVAYLRTGANARSRASGPMAEVVGYSTSLMNEADLRAIAVYLKDLPAAAPTPPAALATSDPAMRTGEALYVDNCMACHRRDGQGVEGIFPILAGSQVVQQPGTDTLMRIIISGVRSVATDGAPTSPGMPAFGWRLNDQQVADVVTYIRNSWGNQAPAASAADATRLRGLVAAAPH